MMQLEAFLRFFRCVCVKSSALSIVQSCVLELLPATYVPYLASEVALWGFVPLGMLYGGKSSARHLGGYSRSGRSAVPAFRDLLTMPLSDWFPSCRGQFLPLSVLLPAGGPLKHPDTVALLFGCIQRYKDPNNSGGFLPAFAQPNRGSYRFWGAFSE
ncbi:hypothetical protein PIB30_025349 [Stylosanthes scabra]|uniref:Uncharacterized protein n=1 Tax=Stylosanthes scabra TaxID=79078 RepID=A0ABU6YC68_9FABA|nr:hypothetical protein [Stylosanthes scabra]